MQWNRKNMFEKIPYLKSETDFLNLWIKIQIYATSWINEFAVLLFFCSTVRNCIYFLLCACYFRGYFCFARSSFFVHFRVRSLAKGSFVTFRRVILLVWRDFVVSYLIWKPLYFYCLIYCKFRGFQRFLINFTSIQINFLFE